MGGNGSFLSGITNFENGRMYKTVSSIGDNIKVLETKNPKKILKLPEESHTPNRTYAAFYRNGKGLKEIAELESLYDLTPDYTAEKEDIDLTKKKNQENNQER